MKYSKTTRQNITKRTDIVLIRVIIVVYVFHHCHIKNLLKVYKSTPFSPSIQKWKISSFFTWFQAKTSELRFFFRFYRRVNQITFEVCLRFSSTYFTKFISNPLQWHSTYPFKVRPKKDVSPRKYLTTMIYCSFDVSSALLIPRR